VGTKEGSIKHSSNFIDITGQRFGRLVVIRYHGYETPKGTSDSRNALWLCKCDCGNEAIVRGSHLRAGETKSCGCITRKHGKSRSNSKTYSSWKGLIQRCLNKNNKRYMDYGGRGIKVCDEWKTFNGFYLDMGDRPNGKTIERVDNNGNYEPNNCSWATPKEQSRNNRSNRIIEHNGASMCISQWAEELGIKKGTLLARINRGWSTERALTAKVEVHNGH